MTCFHIIKHPIFEAISLAVIIVNSFILAMDDDYEDLEMSDMDTLQKV